MPTYVKYVVFQSHNFIFIMGNMTKQLHKNKACHEKLTVQSNGLQDNTKYIYLKINLFPFFISTWTWCL